VNTEETCFYGLVPFASELSRRGNSDFKCNATDLMCSTHSVPPTANTERLAD
jgi:hypothetical protein